MKYNIQVQGCQMNHSDAERIKAVLESCGQKEEKDFRKADLIMFVTCSIKQRAEDKVIGHFKELRKLKIKRPKLQIGLTGCMARTTSNHTSTKKDNLLKSLKGLDFVLRIEDVKKLPQLLDNEMYHESNEQNVVSYFEIAPTYTSSFRAHIPIMTGCNKFCTYCIVPYSRGREVSRSMSNIIEEVNKLVENGCKEITLLGQNVNSYGRTNKVYDKQFIENELEPFARLLTEIDKTGIKRVRFTSPHPHDMTDQVIETICNLKSLCDHVHLPLQAGDNNILKKMNRTYDVEKFRDMVKKFRKHKKDIAISTDIIVGFCGETKEQFQNTLDFFNEIEFDLAYISQYSQRTGTYASKNLKDNVSIAEKKKRFHALNDALREISFRKNKKYLDKEVDVLIEEINTKDKQAIGKTSSYKTVAMPASIGSPGDIVRTKIIDAKEWILEGEKIMTT